MTYLYWYFVPFEQWATANKWSKSVGSIEWEKMMLSRAETGHKRDRRIFNGHNSSSSSSPHTHTLTSFALVSNTLLKIYILFLLRINPFPLRLHTHDDKNNSLSKCKKRNAQKVLKRRNKLNLSPIIVSVFSLNPLLSSDLLSLSAVKRYFRGSVTINQRKRREWKSAPILTTHKITVKNYNCSTGHQAKRLKPQTF